MDYSIKTFLKHTAKDFHNQSVNPPVVRASMAEIQELQEDLMEIMAKQGFNPYSPFTRSHLDLMKKLVEKQQN